MFVFFFYSNSFLYYTEISNMHKRHLSEGARTTEQARSPRPFLVSIETYAMTFKIAPSIQICGIPLVDCGAI